MHPSIHAQHTPDKPAYIMAASGRTIGYRQLEDASNRLAQLLRRLGLQAGERIALMLENHPRYFEICWAAQRAGLVYTAISSRLTAGEAAYIVGDCGARVFITSMALAGQAAELRAQMPAVHTRLMLDGTIDGYEAYEAAVADCPAERIGDECAGGDMLYSSGTTGRPKGVFVAPESTDIAFVNSLLQVCIGPFGMGADTVYLSPGPLYHAAPLRFAMAVMRLGGTVVVMEHFDAAEFLRLVPLHRITHTQVVLDVAVFGVPNEDFGEQVKAVVQPRDMAEAGKALEQELIAFCRERLSAIKCPRSIDFEAELPRHPTGKLYKRLLRDKYWAGQTRKI